MPHFIVYEVWTCSKVVEANNLSDALNNNMPDPIEGLGLSNWRAVEIPAADNEVPESDHGLNYRQVE